MSLKLSGENSISVKLNISFLQKQNTQNTIDFFNPDFILELMDIKR